MRLLSQLPAVVRQYLLVTGNYWAFTLTDGALRMLVLLHFHALGYSPLQISALFLFYEIFGVLTNLFGGYLGARLGLNRTMNIGLGLQVGALLMLTVPAVWLTIPWVMGAQALSGIAKDLNKMSAKSSIKLLVPDGEQGRLYQWVAILTGSKNALKGVGFFMGGALLALLGFSSLAAARALANTFSNTLMIGVPLVGLVFGDAGLVTLFTLISVHSLILLTAATVVFELAAAREHAGREGGTHQPMWRTVLQAMRNGIVHPVPLPIIAGLLFAQTGLLVPEVVGKPLQLLGQALGPIALLLVGVTLAFNKVGHHFKAALRIALVKCVAHPIVLAGLGWALGLSGLPLAVMIVAASLPVGANVFLFAQRYGVAQDEVTASVAVSTALGLVTMPLAILAVTRWVID